MKIYSKLREANIDRYYEWAEGRSLSLSYNGNELAGEVGEACNLIKKIERERLGMVGSRTTVAELEKELADIIICVDIIAFQFGIDLDKAVREKFNETSEKNGFEHRILRPQTGPY